jgi:hypothetical protein
VPDPQLPQEDGRRWTIRVCPVCGNEMGRSTGCLGTIQRQHAPSGAVLVEVVPASQVAALRERLEREVEARDHWHGIAIAADEQVAALRDEVKRYRLLYEGRTREVDNIIGAKNAEVARLKERDERLRAVVGGGDLSVADALYAEIRAEAVEQERKRLAPLIERAPHARHCEASSPMFPGACSCWKKAALAAVLEEEER